MCFESVCHGLLSLVEDWRIVVLKDTEGSKVLKNYRGFKKFHPKVYRVLFYKSKVDKKLEKNKVCFQRYEPGDVKSIHDRIRKYFSLLSKLDAPA